MHMIQLTMDGVIQQMNVYFDGELQLFEMAIAIFGTDINSFRVELIIHIV